MHKKSQNDIEYAWEKEFRMNYMEETLMISFTLKTIELIILILNTSYILGMLWYILCEAIEDFYVGEWYKDNPEKHKNTFMVYFNTLDQSVYHNALSMSYFAFTSLSTVGFGDFYPVSDFERMVWAFVMLFGVAIFSYIMGIFITLFELALSYDEDLDDGDNLLKFFGTLQRFNYGEAINYDLKR